MEKLLGLAKTVAIVAGSYVFMCGLGWLATNGYPVLALFIGMVFAFLLGKAWGSLPRGPIDVRGDHNKVEIRGGEHLGL